MKKLAFLLLCVLVMVFGWFLGCAMAVRYG